MTTQEKLQENAKVIAHPVTTEIIKISERSIQTFPVNKANVQVDKDIFRNDIGTPKYKKARDEQFPKIEVQANCNRSHGTKNLQCRSTEIAVITSQPNVWAN